MELWQSILQALFISLGVLGAVGIIVAIKTYNNRVLNSVIVRRTLYRINQAYKRFASVLYKMLSKFFVTRVMMINLSSMFRKMYVLDEDEARTKAISVVLVELIVISVNLVLSYLYLKDTFLSVILTYMYAHYVYIKLKGDGHKFLVELEDAVSDMIHLYNACGKNIDAVFERILSNNRSYIYKYMDQMYSYLRRAMLNPQDKSIVTEYSNIVASRHLRLIFNYIYMTYRYGDETTEDGEYMFNRNMLSIQREIHDDLVKLEKIKDATLGERFFIILAIIMIPAATWYMRTYFTFEGFETIERFLDGSFGYVIKVICGVVALICYYVYSKVMESNSALEFRREISWEEDIINDHKWVRALLDYLAPQEGTNARRKLEGEISLVEGYAGVRPFYLKKIALTITVTAAVILLVTSDTYVTYMSISSDMYRGINTELMDTITLTFENPEAYKQQSLSNDILVMDKITENREIYDSIDTKERKVDYIVSIIRTNNIDYGAYYEIAANRIYEKFAQLDGIAVQYIILIVVGTALGAYMVPNLTLKLNIILNRGALMFDEVNGCYTVVTLLINHSASNIYMILSWLTSFSRVFKSRFQGCMDNLSEKSIRELEEGLNYKPLSHLVECILLAYNGEAIKSAFAGIEQKQMFQSDQRKSINEQVVEKRVWMSSAISWVAMGTTFILYIMGPMVLAIIEMLSQMQYFE